METVGLSMIVKDEPIDRLVMLIDFLRPLVKEFVIGDTGSVSYEQDKPLLEKAGATVFQIEWRNDFAWARNQTLGYLSTDWVLHLDADEMPSLDMIWWMSGFLDSRTNAAAVRFFTRNFWGGEWGIETHEHWHVRMFRNGRGRWYKPLHEQVEIDGKPEHMYTSTPLCVQPTKDIRVIHSKPRDKMEISALLYKEMENR